MSEVYRTQRRVEFRDTDAAGIVHFSVFFVYMEQAEHEFLRHLGISVVEHREKMKYSWPRVSASCDYRRAVHFEDLLAVTVRVAHLGTKSVRYQVEFHHHDQVVAEGSTSAAYCRVGEDHSLTSVPLPDDIRARLHKYLS